MLVYVDTSALIALATSTDRYHSAATDYFRKAMGGGTRFIIGRPVLVEYIDGVAKRTGKPEAIKELHLLESTAVMRIEPDIEDDHSLGRALFLRYDDQTIDMTDSLSFAMMDRLGLKEAFTFDHDFVVHGFTCRP
jgi:predicted nucleic acid-binding protein